MTIHIATMTPGDKGTAELTRECNRYYTKSRGCRICQIAGWNISLSSFRRCLHFIYQRVNKQNNSFDSES